MAVWGGRQADHHSGPWASNGGSVLIGLMSRLLSAHKGMRPGHRRAAARASHRQPAPAHPECRDHLTTASSAGTPGRSSTSAAWMAGIAAVQVVRPSRPDIWAPWSPWRFAASCAGALREGPVLLLPGGGPFRCAQSRHPGHQRHRADPKPRRPNIHHVDCRTGDLHRRHDAADEDRRRGNQHGENQDGEVLDLGDVVGGPGDEAGRTETRRPPGRRRTAPSRRVPRAAGRRSPWRRRRPGIRPRRP